VTMQSRDQGVDVVAEKSGVRVVLQCKLYARPVGNKSVQEASAARAHEQADYGIVVSNNRYTQDAEQLASANKIILLHYTDLANLDDIIRLRPSPACDSWYYADGDTQVGPLTLQELRKQNGPGFGAISILPCRLVATALFARDCAAVVPFDRSGDHATVLPWADGDTAWADADGDI
jgi:hypothetical protein